MKSSLCALLLAASASACLLPEERSGQAPSGFKPVERRAGAGIPVGTGDRYGGGATAPRGLGSQASSASVSTLLNVAEIKSGLQGLAKTYGISTFSAPYTTHEGATVLGARVGGSGGTCAGAYRVFLNGNIHARERGSMDGVLLFVSDLLYANKTGTGLTYGTKTYTHAQVVSALAAGIVFIPLSNPDGVAYDQATGSCWRKNRNTASGRSGTSVGVDLNRNFDFLWDFEKVFSPDAATSVASTSPSDETFHGLAPFSEPETQNIQWVFDTFPKLRWFVDLHSYAGDVLYSWGSDENQSAYPTMNFRNHTYDGVRGDLDDTPGVRGGYGEYISADDSTTHVTAAKRMAAALTAGGRTVTYTAMQSSDLYPTSGTSDDYAYARHIVDPSKNLVHGFTIEFGGGNRAASCPFYPTTAQHNANMRAIGAGFMELLLAATDLGLGDTQAC